MTESLKLNETGALIFGQSVMERAPLAIALQQAGIHLGDPIKTPKLPRSPFQTPSDIRARR
jgi:hypothetical protein